MTTSKDQIDMIAVSAKVADFDSGNENRDAKHWNFSTFLIFPMFDFWPKSLPRAVNK